MTSKSVICEHHRELIEVLKQVKLDAEGEKRPESFPTRWSPEIWEHLRGETKINVNNAIRQVHNFYGWKAIAGRKRGHCAGALYRTHDYLRIKRNCRDSRRSSPTHNVHIEHTVPVKDLIAHLKAKLSQFSTAEKLHDFLIARSICVAFSYEERCLLRVVGKPDEKDLAFYQDGRERHQYPFRRYRKLKNHEKSFGVVNVVSGEEIDLKRFTFAKHAATLKKASLLAGGSQAVTLYDLEVFGSR